MQFRSIRGRGAAALASGALAASALAIPTVLAAPAQATLAEDVEFSCMFGSSPFSSTLDVDVTALWDKATGRAELSVDVGSMANPAPAFVSIPNAAHEATIAVTVDGAASPISLTGSSVANFQGQVPIDVPVMTGLVGAKAESLSVVIGDLDVTVGSSEFSCSPVETPSAMVVPIEFPEGADLNYVCSFGSNRFAYMTDVDLAAQRSSGGDVTVSAALEDMPNTAPAFIVLEDQAITATLEAGAEGASMDMTGGHTADFTGGVPVVIPALSATSATAADDLSVTLGDFALSVGGTTNIGCTIAEAALVDVSVKAPPAVKTTSKTTAKYAKKKATITTTVKSSAGTPKGKVSYVVKKGKKKVAAAKVALKAGKAKLVVKKAKLKKTGKYTVVATYLGNASFKKSTSKATFVVK
ncbi:Ig-like domain repeat protein [Nocardioides sp. YIM 152588]|uniref:Ig-like domain repeat protein n=1 Tax=Nocardioides sp. YIM 152588 TaxID=3158259 RepID=UPI0032E3BC7D